MKIYFTCSTAEFYKYKDTYFQIRDYIISQGHVLTRDWLPHTYKHLQEGALDIRDIKKIYRDCVDAIQEADLIIIDDTVSNFSTGHQITLALQYRKPILVLWQGRKHRNFKQMFIHGIESDRLQVTEYAPEDLEDIISAFIKKYENVYETNRFHLVIDGVERSYLDWAQYEGNKSRTKIIREALRDKMEKDGKYREYLSSDR